MIIRVKRTNHIFIRNGGIGTLFIIDNDGVIDALLRPWSFIGSSFPTFHGQIAFRLDGIDEPFLYSGIIMFDMTNDDETAMIIPTEIPRFTKTRDLHITCMKRSLIPPCL